MITEVWIEYPGRDGQGVGNDGEGNLYFVPGALPGDRVKVETKENKRYRNATLLEVLDPSPNRQTSPCEYSDRCGGCDWLNWKYDAQLAGKQAHLLHVLRRGDWMPEQVKEPMGAKNPLGYRSRVQLHRGPDGFGFYQRNTHKVIPVDHCEVAHPKISARMENLDSKTGSIELFLDEAGEVQVSHRRGDNPFSQVNPEQNEVLRRKVSEAMEGSSQVLELYSGSGNLTGAYADQVRSVFAFEGDEKAVEEARKRWGREGVMFVADNIDAGLARKLPTGFREQYDTLLLDPPRQGTGFDLGELVHENLKRICYVSCSPISFSKDVQSLKEHFRFQSVQIIDMFPQTRHMELLAVFSR